jgi:hypothetical protein
MYVLYLLILPREVCFRKRKVNSRFRFGRFPSDLAAPGSAHAPSRGDYAARLLRTLYILTRDSTAPGSPEVGIAGREADVRSASNGRG